MNERTEPEQSAPRCAFRLSGERVCRRAPAEGAERCVLHKRERTPEEDGAFTEIVDRMLAEKTYDFRGVIFPENFRGFVHVTFEGPANFERARFQGNADFLGARFLADARFSSALIRGSALFGATHFGGNVNFLRVKIGGDAHFNEAEMKGAALFSALDVAGSLDVANATIESLVQLGGARIGGSASFSRSEIGGAVSFAHSTFGGDLEFTSTKCGAECDFGYVTVGGEAKFGGTEVGGDLIFRSAHIHGTAFFQGARIRGNVGMLGAHVARNVIFTEAEIGGDMLCERMDVDHRAYFYKMRVAGNLDRRAVNVGMFIHFRRARIDGSVEMRGATLPPAGDFQHLSVRMGRGESLCRFAKQVCQNMGEYREAGAWHYRERCHSWYARTFLRKGGRKTMALLNPLTWIEYVVGRLVFGYGESPTNVILSGLAVVAVCAAAYCGLGGITHSGSGEVTRRVADAVYFSVITFTTVGYGDYTPAVTGATRYLAMAEAVAGVFLMSLFVVTLARRWGRG